MSPALVSQIKISKRIALETILTPESDSPEEVYSVEHLIGVLSNNPATNSSMAEGCFMMKMKIFRGKIMSQCQGRSMS